MSRAVGLVVLSLSSQISMLEGAELADADAGGGCAAKTAEAANRAPHNGNGGQPSRMIATTDVDTAIHAWLWLRAAPMAFTMSSELESDPNDLSMIRNDASCPL